MSTEGTAGWDFRPLRADIERLFGRDQVKLIQPCLTSIDDWRGFSRFHFSEAKRLMVESAGDQRLYRVFDLVLRVFDKEKGEFERARFKAEAHITACVHSMHSLADIIGQTIYLGLGMNLDPALAFMDERRISVSNVAERLSAGPVAEHVIELVNGEDFRYLAAMNNHSKHRSLVPVGYALDFTGEQEEPSGLMFNAFRYAGKDHQARWVRPILTAEYQRQETLLHALGNALNAELAGRPSL